MLLYSNYQQQRLVVNLSRIFETHLADHELTVTRLTRLVGMSRTDLHRKLNRIFGMSATEYLRHKRLQRAARFLIERPDWTIGRIALEVGFNSQSYFTMRFSETFGMSPGDYRQQVQPVLKARAE